VRPAGTVSLADPQRDVPLKIAIFSDIHLEFKAGFTPETPDDVDVIVLAGDIGAGTEGIEWAKRELSHLPVIYVAGNHEFYHGHWNQTVERLRASAEGSNVVFLEDGIAVVGGVRFMGSTLWTDFLLFGEASSEAAMQAAIKVMPDFRIIESGISADPLTPGQTVARFGTSRTFLNDSMRVAFDGPTVVVTHHLPHRSSVAERFKDDLVSAAFASDLSSVVDSAQPDVWIHGHTHDSFAYSVGETRVICNPRGYPQKNGTFENQVFDPGLTIEVG
jgi:predicted phosphodiesterase